MRNKDFPSPKNPDVAYYVGTAIGHLIEKTAMVYGKLFSLLHRRSANAYFKIGSLYRFNYQPLWADVWDHEPDVYRTTPNRRKSDPKPLVRLKPGTVVMVLEPLKRHNAGQTTEYATVKIVVGEHMGYVALMAEHSFCPWQVFEKIEINER